MIVDEAAWAALIDGSTCPMCRGTDRIVIATLSSGRVELINDANFIGYCVLVYRRHVVELYDLDADERRQLIEDISQVAQAIAKQCHPEKFNYEMMGNAVPHLHCHIVPRYRNDGYWGGPLWWRPLEKISRLAEAEYKALAERLQIALRTTYAP